MLGAHEGDVLHALLVLVFLRDDLGLLVTVGAKSAPEGGAADYKEGHDASDDGMFVVHLLIPTVLLHRDEEGLPGGGSWSA